MTLAQFRTAEGDTVTVEVVDDRATTSSRPGGVLTRGLGDERLVERTERTLDSVLAHTQPAVRALVASLRSADDAPDEVEVEFGVAVSLEVGAFIAAGSTTANFRVTMRWGRLDRREGLLKG